MTKPAETGADHLVPGNLEKFQDLKFGLMIHWGTYCLWHAVESWSLCAENEPWCERPTGIAEVAAIENRETVAGLARYRRLYEQLSARFDPVDFAPDRWAEAARSAGMKYVVCTAKHHDGFCLFDTAQTDYRITHSGCAFSGNPRANVLREIFAAFRHEGFATGAYFSKPDWHHPDYWAPEFPCPDRNVNYDTGADPARWQRFRDFTYRQIEELMTGYGPLDILWLDGGWVRPKHTINDEVRSWCRSPFDQDIDMPRIAKMARRHQPGLLIADRTVGDGYEDYLTPEQMVPDVPLSVPWETCMTMGQSWSFTPEDRYKSAGELIHLLVQIVAKGGNLLLNVGPDARGNLPPVAYERLAEIGRWLAVNGEAIHGTRPVAPYRDGTTYFTCGADGTRYAVCSGAENKPLPREVCFCVPHGFGKRDNQLKNKGISIGGVRLLGCDARIDWRQVNMDVCIHIPEQVRNRPPCEHAWTFVLT